MNDDETTPPAFSANENVGVAFALVIGAGAATGVGASVVFFPRLVRLASRKTLASALGLSAGVMMFVSFVEIFGKSQLAFTDAGYDPDRDAFLYATLCFFGGVVLMVALNLMVTRLLGGGHHHHQHPHPDEADDGIKDTQDTSGTALQQQQQEEVPALPCCTDDAVANLQNVQNMANEIEKVGDEEWEGKITTTSFDGDGAANNDGVEITGSGDSSDEDDVDGLTAAVEEDQQKLMKMSLNTALAIGLHNFPEGLATFVAALADPKVGGVLAIAIAIHNIPEGLCVAMPVYYATGRRWKAFGWAMLSGIAEPIAALFGYAVLGVAGDFNQVAYGVLFGFVAGMMVIISIRELLPTAHRYDPEDTVVTYSFIGGMIIMALSLALFVL